MYAVYLKDCPTAEMHTGGCGEGRPPDDLLLGGSDMTSSDPPTAGGEKGGGGGVATNHVIRFASPVMDVKVEIHKQFISMI